MSIQEHLNKIRNAVYGHEVRESIAKGIETAYDDASEKDNANMEVKVARGTHPNLRSRLEEVDNKQQKTTAQLAVEKARIDSFTTLATGSTTGDAELIDGRVGADAVAYPNIGGAIRGQVNKIKRDNMVFDTVDATLGKKQVRVPDLALFTTGASAGNTRFSGNATTGDGYLLTVSVKSVRAGVGTICLASEVNGFYYLLTSFTATLAIGENTLINGVDFDYPDIVPSGTIVGLYAVDDGSYPALYYYTDGLSSKTYGGDFSTVGTSGVGVSTAAYNVSIGLTVYTPFYTKIENQYMYAEAATLTNNGVLGIPSAIGAIKKKLNISFFADVSALELIHIGYRAENGTSYDRITIDDTNVTVADVNNATVATYPHGLSIANNIAVLIRMNYNETADITIMSNGAIYTKNGISWFRMIEPTYPYALASTATTLANCRLSWTSEDFNKLIYAYGDSYFNYADTRWMYYANQYGFMDNMLVNAFAGSGSVSALKGLRADLKCGKPKYILWTLGMNDGSDTTEPNATWLANVKTVISICENSDIIPILATIPTVPTRNMEHKNAWVRASGHHYIDFAKAVGADAVGNWYPNMLETGMAENIHPSAIGAKALFMKACADFPHMMVK